MLINGRIIHNELLTRWCKAPARVKVCVTNYQPSCTLNGHHPSPSSSPRWCRSWRTRSYLILNHFLNFPFNWVNAKVLHDGIRINENCNNEIMSMMICIFLRFRIYHHSLKRCVFTLTNRRGAREDGGTIEIREGPYPSDFARISCIQWTVRIDVSTPSDAARGLRLY